MWETWVQPLGWKDPLEKETAAHSSILAWRNTWTEEPGGYRPWGHKESDTTLWLSLTHSWNGGCIPRVDFLRGPDRNFLVSLSFRGLTASLSVKVITNLMAQARGGDIDSSSRWKWVSRILGPCFKTAALLMYIPVSMYCHFELIKQLCRKKKKTIWETVFVKFLKLFLFFPILLMAVPTLLLMVNMKVRIVTECYLMGHEVPYLLILLFFLFWLTSSQICQPEKKKNRDIPP